MHIPEPGDLYKFTVPMATAGGNTFEPGDGLHLLDITNEVPHGYVSKICNFKVRCKHRESSVWASIWTLIEQGNIVYVPVEETT